MSNKPEIQTKKLNAGYHNQLVIKNLDLTIPMCKVSVIIGSNGSGKSTLLKTLTRIHKYQSGHIFVNNKEINQFKIKEFARNIALLPQSAIVPNGIKVIDLVSRGRYPYQKPLKSYSQCDYEAIENALNLMNIKDLQDMYVDELSGGQRQRVWLALALAQETDIIFLDEPTTYLDISYQIEILDLIRELNQKKSITIVMVLHEINLALRYADYIFALKNGECISHGEVESVLDEKLIKDVYGIQSMIINDPVSNKPMIIPIGKANTDAE